MKYTIHVNSWHFDNFANQLQLFMLTEGNSTSGATVCPNIHTSQDGSHNLQWFTLNIGGVTLYPTHFYMIQNFTRSDIAYKITDQLN